MSVMTIGQGNILLDSAVTLAATLSEHTEV